MLVYNQLTHYAPNYLKCDGGDYEISPIPNGGGDREIPSRLFRGDR